jgi:hypothetical protein
MEPASRARRRVTAALVSSLVAAWLTKASAHRTEDYLQAARIGLEPGRVGMTLDLTPGTAVAESFVVALDGDGDGALSAEEQRRYAAGVQSALTVELDERALRTRVVSWSFPPLSAFRRGVGMVRLRIETSVSNVSPGAHRLRFRNAHLAGHSAYLANALISESPRVVVTAQRRTRDQSELTIEFTVRRP